MTVEHFYRGSIATEQSQKVESAAVFPSTFREAQPTPPVSAAGQGAVASPFRAVPEHAPNPPAERPRPAPADPDIRTGRFPEARLAASATPEPMPDAELLPGAACPRQTGEPSSGDSLLYDPAELERIVTLIRETVDPERIFLFGALAGATPHSDVAAYDLLIVVRDDSPAEWTQFRRHFNLKLIRRRIAPLLNFYLCPEQETQQEARHFYRFVQSEGTVLYSRRPFKLKTCDYRSLYWAARERFDAFFPLTGRFLKTAQESLAANDVRGGAFCAGQAAELLLRTLFGVYHGCDTGLHNVSVLWLRTRTLSARLAVSLENDNSGGCRVAAQWENFRREALYAPVFDAGFKEVDEYLRRLQELERIVERVCRERMTLYESRIEES